ncbi:MAG TPA: PadR family transcriptional regulator [Terriglobales bacterium]|nr:PadR family transcriptional regulator [Terriglobales bacterium]
MRTVKAGQTSSLGFALLGLLQQTPSSGYDLRKVFSATAMTTYSDSPGAIYPALRRLQQQGLISGSVESGAGMRRRRIFRLTRRGLAELRKWITRPVDRSDVIRSLHEVMLRFAYSEPAAGAAASIRLLASLEKELRSYIPLLHRQMDSLDRATPASRRLALESGIRGYESLLHWAMHARRTYRQSKRKVSAS